MTKQQEQFRETYERAMADIQYLDICGVIPHGEAKKAFARVAKFAAKLGLGIKHDRFRYYTIELAKVKP